MTEPLNPDQIAALVEAAKHGDLPDPDARPASGRKSQKLRTVDFSRPTKFTSDHQRRIERAIETFCQTAMTRLSAELRSTIELETINVAQMTWAVAESQLASGSLSALLELQPLGTRMMLSVEESFALICLECLLGGTPDLAPRSRRLSEIDWVLTRRLFDSIVHQLSAVWGEMAGVTLAIDHIDVQSDPSQMASVSEPTLVVVLESRINKHSAAVTLAIPWMAIEPIADRIAGRDEQIGESEAGLREIERAMATVPVTLRAEVASIEMTAEQILALAPGAVVRLGARAEHGVSLFAENVKLGRANPGCNGSKRAIQVSGVGGTAR